MDSKTSQTQLSAEYEKILKDAANQQGDKLARQRSEDSREAEPEDSPINNQGWIAVQTLLVRATVECSLNDSISAFLDQVDDSHYSLADWLDALLRFDSWLTEKEIETRPLDSMIGYIHCCTMTSAETLSPPELARLVQENLEQWGFEASQPVDSTSG